MMMIHNPMTAAIGDSREMQKAIDMLEEVKESIINAYSLKTGVSRSKLSKLMDAETWMNAKKALELGFADSIMFSEDTEADDGMAEAMLFSRAAVNNSLMDKLRSKFTENKIENKVDAGQLQKRLSLIMH